MPFLEQVLRAAFFDGRVYRTIGDTPEAMFRSLAVVAAAGIAFGLGIRGIIIEGRDDGPTAFMLLAFSTAIIGWLVWATVVYPLGTRLLRGRAGHRATGACGPWGLPVLDGPSRTSACRLSSSRRTPPDEGRRR